MSKSLCKINNSEFRLNMMLVELLIEKGLGDLGGITVRHPKDIKHDPCIILFVNNTSILILGAIFRIRKECTELVLEKLGAQQKQQNTSLISESRQVNIAVIVKYVDLHCLKLRMNIIPFASKDALKTDIEKGRFNVLILTDKDVKERDYNALIESIRQKFFENIDFHTIIGLVKDKYREYA